MQLHACRAYATAALRSPGVSGQQHNAADIASQTQAVHAVLQVMCCAHRVVSRVRLQADGVSR